MTNPADSEPSSDPTTTAAPEPSPPPDPDEEDPRAAALLMLVTPVVLVLAALTALAVAKLGPGLWAGGILLGWLVGVCAATYGHSRLR